MDFYSSQLLKSFADEADRLANTLNDGVTTLGDSIDWLGRVEDLRKEAFASWREPTHWGNFPGFKITPYSNKNSSGYRIDCRHPSMDDNRNGFLTEIELKDEDGAVKKHLTRCLLAWAGEARRLKSVQSEFEQLVSRIHGAVEWFESLSRLDLIKLTKGEIGHDYLIEISNVKLDRFKEFGVLELPGRLAQVGELYQHLKTALEDNVSQLEFDGIADHKYQPPSNYEALHVDAFTPEVEKRLQFLQSEIGKLKGELGALKPKKLPEVQLPKSDNPPLTKHQRAIVEACTGKMLIQVDIAAATDLSDRTVSAECQTLEGLGLLHRPQGPRKGYTAKD